MKARTITIASIAALLLAAGTVSAIAATSDQARKEACFREHGKLMSKPALMNPNDCWRAHGYLMGK